MGYNNRFMMNLNLKLKKGKFRYFLVILVNYLQKIQYLILIIKKRINKLYSK